MTAVKIGRVRWSDGPLSIEGNVQGPALVRTVLALVVPEAAAGRRLDAFLAMKVASRAEAQRLISEGRVRINGDVAEKASTRLDTGERLLVRLPRPRPQRVEPERIPIDVLYEDDYLIVLNKAKGMVVHPAPGNSSGTLVNALLHHCGGRLSDIGDWYRRGVVHRLDKDTSGCLVMAKTNDVHRHLAQQIRDHTAKRVYVALVHGTPSERGRVEAPIGRHPVRRKEMAVVSGGKPATTDFRVLEYLGSYSLVEAHLQTGRTHQIRVHMAHIGCPVVGDPVYGPRRVRLLCDGQALHAWQLGFLHPVYQVGLRLVAPLPASFVRVLAALRSQLDVGGQPGLIT